MLLKPVIKSVLLVGVAVEIRHFDINACNVTVAEPLAQYVNVKVTGRLEGDQTQNNSTSHRIIFCICTNIFYFLNVVYSVTYRGIRGSGRKYSRESPWQVHQKRNFRLIRKITSCMKKLVKVSVPVYIELSASHLMRLWA